MNENFLQFIFKYKLFDFHNLVTDCGKKLEILSVGDHNFSSGPDFMNSKIKVDNDILVGCIEIHINKSDWQKHKHQNDPAYNLVILNVYYQDDSHKNILKNISLFELNLKPYIRESVINNYNEIYNNKFKIPCEKLINCADKFIIKSFLNRLLVERLENKTNEIFKLYEENNNDWEITTYKILFKYMGTNINSGAFERLTNLLPLSVVLKNNNNLFKLESLFIGQANLLNENSENEYEKKMIIEYNYLSKLYNLNKIKKGVIKTGGVRPMNFPIIKLSILASIYYNNSGIFSKIIEAKDVEDIKKIFDKSASEFWDFHYNFTSKSNKKIIKKLGKQSLEGLIINVVIPIIFCYSKHIGDYNLSEKAIGLYENLKGEENSLIKYWENMKVNVNSAFETQGIIELTKNYCYKKKCLNCDIFQDILSKA